MCCRQFGMAIHDAVKPVSSQPSAKKHTIISVNCRRPARILRTGGRPDHGPKNGARLVNLELRPHFSGTLFGVAKRTHELLHRALYRQQGRIRWYMCCRQFGMAIHDAVKPVSSQPSAKKHTIISVNCRRPARILRTGGRPDHGPKNGATNLEAGLVNLELRPHFWVLNLALFLGSQNTHTSCYIELRIGSKEGYAGTCAAAISMWAGNQMIL